MNADLDNDLRKLARLLSEPATRSRAALEAERLARLAEAPGLKALLVSVAELAAPSARAKPNM